jgi:hypothetical protein
MAYTSDSASDRLAAVRSAISACLTSQQYTVRGRSQMMAQLRDLRELEKDLMQEVVDSNAGGGMASLAIVTRAT